VQRHALVVQPPVVGESEAPPPFTTCPLPAWGLTYAAAGLLCRHTCPLLPTYLSQVHGTCLGFEALAIIVSRNTSVLSGGWVGDRRAGVTVAVLLEGVGIPGAMCVTPMLVCADMCSVLLLLLLLCADMDALNAPAPLLYTESAATSAWLQALQPHVVTNLQNTALAMENHAHGGLAVQEGGAVRRGGVCCQSPQPSNRVGCCLPWGPVGTGQGEPVLGLCTGFDVCCAVL
jgi:hypothetical protein